MQHADIRGFVCVDVKMDVGLSTNPGWSNDMHVPTCSFQFVFQMKSDSHLPPRFLKSRTSAFLATGYTTPVIGEQIFL